MLVSQEKPDVLGSPHSPCRRKHAEKAQRKRSRQEPPPAKTTPCSYIPHTGPGQKLPLLKCVRSQRGQSPREAVRCPRIAEAL